MKKQIISAIIIAFLILTIFSSVSTSYSIKNECNCENNKVEKPKITIDEKYPTMIEPMIFPDPKYETEKPILVDTPDEFSWANINGKDWTTPAKHQGACGSCWDFAAIGVLESIIKIRENSDKFNPDLSEQYVLSCIQGAGSCFGGSSYEAVKLIMEESPKGNNVNGVPFETCFNYFADHNIPCSDKCENWQEQLVPISDYGLWRSNGGLDDLNYIKSEIYQNGPVVTHIKATDAFKIWGSLNHNPDSYYPYLKKVLGLNHVVMIVGWKDDPSIRKGGYWICKNSWGTEWGYDGFFNIEYNALNIDSVMIVTVDYDPASFDWPPVADAGGSYGAKPGETINFDASNSYGIESDILGYLWDFGPRQRTGKSVQYSYPDEGVYQVILNVKDENNNIGTTSANVWIQNQNQPANTPSINGKDTGTLGSQVKFTFMAEDPEENDVYFYIDWGDGDIEEWIGPYESGEEVTIAHSWNKIKSFTIKAKAKDVFGDESGWASSSITLPRNRELQNNKIFDILQILFPKFLPIIQLIKIIILN
jgi:C1A family cysteine protease